MMERCRVQGYIWIWNQTEQTVFTQSSEACHTCVLLLFGYRWPEETGWFSHNLMYLHHCTLWGGWKRVKNVIDVTIKLLRGQYCAVYIYVVIVGYDTLRVRNRPSWGIISNRTTKCRVVGRQLFRLKCDFVIFFV